MKSCLPQLTPRTIAQTPSLITLIKNGQDVLSSEHQLLIREKAWQIESSKVNLKPENTYLRRRKR